MSKRLIDTLCQASFYPHPVDEVRLIETHISWLFLTGPYAYKVKKPVDFGFLDFSSLARRKHFCLEELRLNRRTAADLYLGVLPITEDPRGRLRLGCRGRVLDYALRMRQFDPEALLQRLLHQGQVDEADILELAATLADFHQRIERADPATPFGSPAAVLQPVAENFAALRRQLPAGEQQTRLQTLEQQTLAVQASLHPWFERRRRDGFVRECHGDLHLGNIARVAGRLVLFDAIEFSEDLRWIDVINDLAFLLMDLRAQGRDDFANRLLNRYLELTGDYHGLGGLRFYQSYRAMVRAKVAALRMGQQEGEQRRQSLQAVYDYLALAEQCLQTAQPLIVLTHGLSGSGKSWLAARLAPYLEAIHIRSDVERKRLHRLPPEADSQRAGVSIYDPASSEKTYQRLAELSRQIIDYGYSVIVDATFLQRAQRQGFHTLARSLGVGLVILHCQADYPVLERRIRQRQQARQDASEADLAVLRGQRQRQQVLAAAETAYTVSVDTSESLDLAALAGRLRRQARQ